MNIIHVGGTVGMFRAMPPLASLRAFEAFARYGSVKLAAEHLKLTSSAISHQIRAVEVHFGVQMVQSIGRTIVLTESGAAYASAVLNAFNELTRAGELLDPRRTNNIVRLSVTPTFATLAAIPHLTRFGADNADLELRLEARNVPVDFSSDPIDAAVQTGSPPFPGLAFHRLFHSRIVPCVHQILLDRYGPIRHARDLAKLPLIDFATGSENWRTWFGKHETKLPSIEPNLTSESLLTAIQMAVSGMGVILAPVPLVSSMIASGALTAIDLWPPMPSKTRDFYLTYRKVDVASRKIKALQSWLKLVVRELESRASKLGL